MSLKTEAIKRFLTAARSLANQGMSKEAIMQFAKNEFGEITELFQRQIDNIFKRPASGIEKIKVKDEVFDDTVIKLPVDDTGAPFNPKDPMKQYGKPKKAGKGQFTKAEYLIQRLKNTIKANPDDKYVQENFPNMIKELEANPDLAKNENVFRELGGDLPSNQKITVYDDDTLDFATLKPTKKFRLNKEKFQKDFNVADDEVERIIKLSSEDQQKELQKYINKDFKEKIELADYDVTDLEPNAKGGIVGYYTGGMVDVEPNLSDIGHGSDALMARTRLMSPGSQATTSTGLNYLLAEDNDNIRVPFAGGGSDRMPTDYEKFLMQKKLREMQDFQNYMKNKDIEKRKHQFFEMNTKTGPGPTLEAAEGGRIGFSKGKIAKELLDKGRRGFMKTVGSIRAGIAGLKAGLLGFGDQAAPVAEKVVETVSETAQGVPPYFLNLVKKIKNLGVRSDGYKERSENFRYKDYDMDIDYDTGVIEIKKTKEAMIPGGDEAGISEEVYMTYKPGMGDETTRGKPADEYEEFTARPDIDGKMKDVEAGVPDEVIEEGTMFEDNITDFKKADGGRIGYSKGKLALKAGEKIKTLGSRTLAFLEKIFGKEAMAEMPSRDPELYKGLLEVTEAFRARDKEGLKMYLQKYLPHMDDTEIEEFIIGTRPDIEGIQGQLLRLGSGRDYKGKLDMMREASQKRKLADLEVTEDMKRKPNASGGIAKLLGE